MSINPFYSGLVYENDPEDLIIPYKLVSRTDYEVITARYQRLRKSSNGLIVRLGIPELGAKW